MLACPRAAKRRRDPFMVNSDDIRRMPPSQLAEHVSKHPSDYPRLPHAMRSEVSVGHFDVAAAAIRGCGHTFSSWISRDETMIPADHPDRLVLVSRQRMATWHAIQQVGVAELAEHIPDSFYRSLTSAQVLRFVTEMAREPRLDEHTRRLLHAHQHNSLLMPCVAARVPRVIHLMHGRYAKSCRLITDAVGFSPLQYNLLHSSLRVATAYSDLPMRVAEHLVSHVPSLYPHMDWTVRYCHWQVERSVRLAVMAMETDVYHYMHIPAKIRELSWTVQAMPDLVPHFSNIGGTFHRAFVQEGMSFAASAAMAAVEQMAGMYQYVPLAVTNAVDACTGNDFTLSAVIRQPSNGRYVPLQSGLFEDSNICVHVLSNCPDSTIYMRFPLSTRSNPAVAALLRVDLPDMDCVVAAIPPDTLMGPDMPPAFLERLQDAVTACTDAEGVFSPADETVFSHTYREMLFAHPSALRMLNEQLFDELLAWYDVTYAALASRLPHDICIDVMELTFGGAGHMARLREAVLQPPAEVMLNRAVRGLRPPPPTQLWAMRIGGGALTAFPTFEQFHDDRWLMSRHVAEHGTFPTFCDAGGPRCGGCFRCRSRPACLAETIK